MTDLTIATLERFSSKFVIDNNHCWLWTANKSYDGYGRFMLKGKVRFAHRVAYAAIIGEVGSGKELDHLCRVRHCVNPSHLEAVTHAENVRRGDGNPKFAEYNGSKTHCPSNHEYSTKNTRFEKCKTSSSGYSRKCRECDRLRQLKIRRDKRNES